jgi:hypothetical protein
VELGGRTTPQGERGPPHRRANLAELDSELKNRPGEHAADYAPQIFPELSTGVEPDTVKPHQAFWRTTWHIVRRSLGAENRMSPYDAAAINYECLACESSPITSSEMLPNI